MDNGDFAKLLRHIPRDELGLYLYGLNMEAIRDIMHWYDIWNEDREYDNIDNEPEEQ